MNLDNLNSILNVVFLSLIKAQSIAHSIGQAFQVAYVEFLKANGIDDPSFTRDIDYQEVLNQQEIGSEELDRFSKKECQKEVIFMIFLRIQISSTKIILSIGYCSQVKKRATRSCDCRKWMGINVADRCHCKYDAWRTSSKVCFIDHRSR